ncbi:MAG: hypothetical protein ABIX28_21450 [Vicinamibacterales bacterium]
MAGKVKTWVWIVLGVVIACVVTAVVVAGSAFYFLSKQFETHSATVSNANREFDSAKARFRGQQPLVELDRDGGVTRANAGPAAAADMRIPEHVVVMAFDPDDERIVRVTLPFWLLRLKSRHASINFNGKKMDLEDLKLTVADLERYGPTLIIDQTSPDGTRVLVWSQ